MILIGALLNTAACGVVTSRLERQVTQQDIVLHIFDKDGHPVPGARVQYQRYGYGSGGSTVFDDEGGPIFSDNSGAVIIPSRQMRYETRATISKPEYREILLTLEMQFSQHDRKRGNSGGPLTDRQGRLIGLLTLKSMKSQNLGFAIPVQALQTLLQNRHPIL
jgi:hypothetical protein